MLTATVVGASSSCKSGDDPLLTETFVTSGASMFTGDWAKLWLGVKMRSGTELGVEGWDPGEEDALLAGYTTACWKWPGVGWMVET